MRPELLAGGIAVLLLACLVGLVFGLWWGERGRRIAAENMAVYGQPRARPARVLPQPVDAEQRARNYGHNPDTIEKGIAHVQAEARKQGLTLSREDAEAQVLYLLHPDSMAEGQMS